jgi:hypothetical protein
MRNEISLPGLSLVVSSVVEDLSDEAEPVLGRYMR